MVSSVIIVELDTDFGDMNVSLTNQLSSNDYYKIKKLADDLKNGIQHIVRIKCTMYGNLRRFAIGTIYDYNDYIYPNGQILTILFPSVSRKIAFTNFANQNSMTYRFSNF